MRSNPLRFHTVSSTILLLLGLSYLVTGCATNVAPKRWHSHAVDAQREGYGSWIEITSRSAPGSPTWLGELIAVETDSIYVLETTRLHAIPISMIVRARLFAYDANWGQLAAWTTIGTFGSLTHGLFGLISIPVWGITGSIATTSQSHMPVYTWPEDPWTELSPFARFPVGLPDAVREGRVALRGKR